MGGVYRGGRVAPASRGDDAQGQLPAVAHRDGAGGEGGRAEGERGRPGDGRPPLPQGRPSRQGGRRRHALRGARAVRAVAARDGRGRALRKRHVRARRRLFRAAQRHEPRNGGLPQGAGLRARGRPLAPRLPGPRRRRARGAMGRLPRLAQEPRRRRQPLHRGGRLHQGDRRGHRLPPVGQGGADCRDAAGQRGQALLQQNRQALRGCARL
mmetsp:Transcript_28675/g.62787  ORF Transcript_28675/g.62787 Transcript_28675/m.62787 type:complete len:211 (-) Transcript_28675:2802-3434(-)